MLRDTVWPYECQYVDVPSWWEPINGVSLKLEYMLIFVAFNEALISKINTTN